MASTSQDIPRDAASFLDRIGMLNYITAFVTNGLETTFAIGLLSSVDQLMDCGVWLDDAEVIWNNMSAPRSLVGMWTPLICRIPTTGTVARFLQCTPVPLLAQRDKQLAACGYDCLPTLKHVQFEDCYHEMRIPLGHSLALHHIALTMNDPGSLPKHISMSLQVWLEHLSPPMHHYEGVIKLECPHVKTVDDLIKLTKADVMAMLISTGHKRTLFHYILCSRTRWLDCL